MKFVYYLIMISPRRLPALALLLCFFPLSGLLTSCSRSPKNTLISLSGSTMGTIYRIKLVAPAVDNKTAREVSGQIAKALESFDFKMSHYRSDSELSAINDAGPEKPIQLSAAVFDVLNLAFQIHLSTEGAFDVTVGPLVNLWGFGPGSSGISDSRPPSDEDIIAAKELTGMKNLLLTPDRILIKKTAGIRLDLSAVAKGAAVDLISSLLVSRGYDNHLVEIGGEVFTSGLNAKGEKWRIAIENPDADSSDNRLHKTLQFSNTAMATSGNYRNNFERGEELYSHIIDPRTGRPIEASFVSASVVASSCALADAAATALLVMGPEAALAWVEAQPDMECLLLTRNSIGTLEETPSSGLSSYLIS